MSLDFKRVCTNSNCGKVEMVRNFKQANKPFCRSCQISAKKKGRPSWNSGKTDVYNEETKKSMGAKNKGKVLTEEHRNSISKGLIESYVGRESVLKGKTLTEDHKLKISNTLINLPEETKIEINTRRSVAAHETYEKKTSEERHLIQIKKGTSLMSFSNTELREQLVKLRLKPTFEIPDNQDNFQAPVRRNLECFCGTVWHVHLFDIVNERTRSCGCTKSFGELQIRKFVESLGIKEKIIKNNRPTFMDGLELDIWLKDSKFAIEYHGLSWHSERVAYMNKLEGEDFIEAIKNVKTLHERKYLLSKKEGVKLIQFYEDEWRDKREICESMIRSKLNLITDKIYARDCEVVLLNLKGRRKFFKENHMDGNTSASYGVGLMYHGEIVAGLSMRYPNNSSHRKNGYCEIARFSVAKNFNVPGAFSRLLKRAEEWACSKNFKKILTFADCRFGSGGVYLNNGFTHTGKTEPGYDYENKKIRKSRHAGKHRAKLSIDSETLQQNSLGWYAIYDAGNQKFEKSL